MIGYVKRLGKEIKETWKEDRSTLIVYFTLRALVILCMVLQILRGDLQNILLCVLTLILLLIPLLKFLVVFQKVIHLIGTTSGKNSLYLLCLCAK